MSGGRGALGGAHLERHLCNWHDERAGAGLSEGFCPCCWQRLLPVTWDVQTVPEAIPGERNVGECLPCGWTYSVVGGDFSDWLAAGWTSEDEAWPGRPLQRDVAP